MKEVLKKLNLIQNELNVPKSKSALGGRYYYRSADDILKALKPLLKEYNCVLTLSDEITYFNDCGTMINQSIDKKGEKVVTKTSLSRFYVTATAIFYDAESGEKIETKAQAREDHLKLGMDVAQLTGSASSYARKYALAGLFGLDDEKDLDEK